MLIKNKKLLPNLYSLISKSYHKRTIIDSLKTLKSYPLLNHLISSSK
nr:MAG TPA: hypothetical protein [Microviridae sp.]